MFVRERRYTVIKNKDLAAAGCTQEELSALSEVLDKVARHRHAQGKAPLCCAVVESDWPEYEPTWHAIEARMEGRLPQLVDRVEQVFIDHGLPHDMGAIRTIAGLSATVTNPTAVVSHDMVVSLVLILHKLLQRAETPYRDLLETTLAEWKDLPARMTSQG